MPTTFLQEIGSIHTDRKLHRSQTFGKSDMSVEDNYKIIVYSLTINPNAGIENHIFKFKNADL